MGRMPVKRWPVRLTAINLPIDHVLRLFYRVVLTPRFLIPSCKRGGELSLLWVLQLTCIRPTMHIFIKKDGAPVEFIPFA